jgi:hypothetical protein
MFDDTPAPLQGYMRCRFLTHLAESDPVAAGQAALKLDDESLLAYLLGHLGPAQATSEEVEVNIERARRVLGDSMRMAADLTVNLVPAEHLDAATRRRLVDRLPFVARWIFITAPESELSGYIAERMAATGCDHELSEVLWSEHNMLSLDDICATLTALARLD